MRKMMILVVMVVGCYAGVFFLTGAQVCAQMQDPPPVPSAEAFAEYHEQHSQQATEMARTQIEHGDGLYMSRFSSSPEGSYRCEQVDGEVRVYSTSLSIHEVRNRYIEYLVDTAKDHLPSPEALEQFRRQFIPQVVDEISSKPLVFDLEEMDMMIDMHEKMNMPYPQEEWECHRKLYPELKDKTGKGFAVEMQVSRSMLTESYTHQRVIVSQPDIDIMDCTLSDKTWIHHTIYHMSCEF